MTSSPAPDRVPRTEAGRRLLASSWSLGPGEPLMADTILAIEAAARAEALAERDAAVVAEIGEISELLELGRDLKARADDVITLENSAYDKGRAEALAELRRGVEGDAAAAAAHDAWYNEKARRLSAAGRRQTWPSETGEEQLRPWSDLSEPVRDFDRIVVRAAVLALLADPPK